MRILIATDSFLPRWDGIARFLDEVIPRLSREYHISVLAPEFRGEFKGYDNVTISRFRASWIKLADYNISFPSRKIIREYVKEADIVWTQTIGPIGAFAVLEAKKQNKPVIAYIHSIEWELFTKSLSLIAPLEKFVYNLTKRYARFLYNKCDLLLVPSKEIAEIFRLSGISAQKKILHLGTNASKFAPSNDKAAVKAKLGIFPKMKVVGFAGRIGKEKDILTLYRAFVRIQKNHDDVALVIVGQDLAGVTKSFRDKANIKVIGYTNDIISYLQAMDVYVLPSLTETTSLSTIEAMSCGLPVVVTKVGYVAEYVKDSHNGFFFPKRNSYILSRIIEKLLEDERLRERIGRNARNTVIEQFSWEATIKQLKEVLEVFKVSSDESEKKDIEITKYKKKQ